MPTSTRLISVPRIVVAASAAIPVSPPPIRPPTISVFGPAVRTP